LLIGTQLALAAVLPCKKRFVGIDASNWKILNSENCFRFGGYGASNWKILNSEKLFQICGLWCKQLENIKF
jgi:hypothetical protein